MGIRMPSTTAPDPAQDGVLQREMELCAQYLELITCVSAKRYWSELHWEMCLPEVWCAIFDEDEEFAKSMMQHARKVWYAMLQLVRFCEERKVSKQHRILLQDMYWKNMPFVHDAAVLSERCDWQHDNEELRLHVWALAGSLQSTQVVNETTFGV